MKLCKRKCKPGLGSQGGYRTVVHDNGKADFESLLEDASKNTTLHKAELRLAFDLLLDTICENIKEGKRVELRGICQIGYSVSGAMTETPEEQTAVKHALGLTFRPGRELKEALESIPLIWSKE